MMENTQLKKPVDPKGRWISLAVLVAVLITFWYMLNIVLLTFLLTFIFYHLLRVVQAQLAKVLPVRVPDSLMILLLYGLFVVLLIVVSTVAAPVVFAQLMEIVRLFTTFDINTLLSGVRPSVAEFIIDLGLNQYVGAAGAWLTMGATKVGGFGANILLALLLSLLILPEKRDIQKFGEKLSESRISFIYDYIMHFGGSFVKTFGQVMKVQVLIAFINGIASMVFLKLLGFPSIIGLGVMIFALGLIPVAGVVISLIPLSIIAFNIGGFSKVLMVLVMIIVIHSLEAYILNPKLMSNRTKLPVCFVFIILLIGEHYIGVWGLLIGVPLFIFALEMFGVKYTER